MPKNSIKVLLFDLGGVLFRLHDPIETFGLKVSHAEFMKRWLLSAAVRDFECGAIDAEIFSQRIVIEADLGYSAEEFLQRFDNWPDCLYPQTIEILESIPQQFELAVLSNTNTRHWEREDIADVLSDYFSEIFLSFKTGLLKPDARAFEHVVNTCGCDAPEILFFDDHPLNVAAAQEFGCHAVQIRCPDDIRSALGDFGIVTLT